MAEGRILNAMNNKRSWIQVALVLVVFASLVDQSVGLDWPFGKNKDKVVARDYIKESGVRQCVYVPAERLTLEHFNKFIGYSMTDAHCETVPRTYEYYEQYPGADRPFVTLLAWTQKKDEKNAIVGKYSVRQLLDWVRLDPNDCTSEKLDERRNQCTELEPSKIGLPDEPKLYRKNVLRGIYEFNTGREPLEYMRYFNLHKYCTKNLESLEKLCYYKQFVKAHEELKVNTEALDPFKEAIKARVAVSKIRSYYDYQEKVEEVFGETDPTEAEKIKTNCAELVKELRPYYKEAKYSYASDKHEYNKICLIIERLIENSSE